MHLAAAVFPSAAAREEAIVNTSGQITTWQWFRLPGRERQRRLTEFRAADAALQGYEPPDREETETYLTLNGLVNDLWPTVPWWCRL